VLTDFGMRIAPSAYYAAVARRPPARALRDEELKKDITRVYEENYSVYGAEKVWWALNREGIVVGRCRVERLMRALGLVGAVRGRRSARPCPTRTVLVLPTW
jgi:putative transposase